MLVQDLLESKELRFRNLEKGIVSASEGDYLDQAAAKLVEHDIGALVVLDGEGRFSGIISERDIVAQVVEGKFEGHRVKEAMSGDVIIADPSDDIDQVLSLMSEHHIRHLPVKKDDEVVGIISIRDVLLALNKQCQRTNKSLKNYITGSYPQ